MLQSKNTVKKACSNFDDEFANLFLIEELSNETQF